MWKKWNKTLYQGGIKGSYSGYIGENLTQQNVHQFFSTFEAVLVLLDLYAIVLFNLVKWIHV